MISVPQGSITLPCLVFNVRENVIVRAQKFSAFVWATRRFYRTHTRDLWVLLLILPVLTLPGVRTAGHASCLQMNSVCPFIPSVTKLASEASLSFQNFDPSLLTMELSWHHRPALSLPRRVEIPQLKMNEVFAMYLGA